MQGVFVSNAFLRGEKYSEPGRMFLDSASDMGIGLRLLTNADLMAGVGDWEALDKVLGDTDFVLFWDKDVDCALNLEVCGYNVFNPASCIAMCDDKARTHMALMDAGIPSIDTIVCPLSFFEYGDMGFLDRAAEELGFPMVVKDRFGSFGQQVHLCKDIDALRELVTGPYVPRILQRFVDCGGMDRRLEVVDGEVVAAMERTAPEGDFRSNLTNGGTAVPCEPTDEEAELALSACESVGALFAGVDIMQGEEGPVVCEINSNAHMKNLLAITGIDVSGMILDAVGTKVGR